MKLLIVLLLAILPMEFYGKAEVRVRYLSPYSFSATDIKTGDRGMIRMAEPCRAPWAQDVYAVFGQIRPRGYRLFIPAGPLVCVVRDWNGPLTLHYP